MVKYAPKKVFVLENGTYLELSYAKFRQQKDTYQGRHFLPLHGMLMEVSEDAYKAFYKEQRRQKYLNERSNDNGDFSYDMLTMDDFNGEDISVDTVADTQGQAERNLLLDKLRNALEQLSADDRELIQALYINQQTEREYAAQIGVYHNAIHYRKERLLAKLKKLLRN